MTDAPETAAAGKMRSGILPDPWPWSYTPSLQTVHPTCGQILLRREPKLRRQAVQPGSGLGCGEILKAPNPVTAH